MKIGDKNITMQNREVGPWHDPYLERTLTVSVNKEGVQCKASWTESGLAANVLELFVDKELVRQEVFPFIGNSVKNRLMELKWQLLFKRHVGIHPHDAENFYNENYSPDPMGEPSMYI